MLIALGIIVLVCSSAYRSNDDSYYNSHNGWKIAVAVFAFVLAIIIFCMFFFYSAELRLQGIFLEYARRFLHDWMAVYAYIPLFMFFTAGLIALFMFQHLAFSSKGVANSDLWDFSNPGALGVLNIIEFIWAFQFLRDACNCCLTQSTSASPVAPPTGTGTPTRPSAPALSPDSSPDTGVASLQAPSSTVSSKSPLFSSNSSPATPAPAAENWETPAKTNAAAASSSTSSEPMPTATSTFQVNPSATLPASATTSASTPETSLWADSTP